MIAYWIVSQIFPILFRKGTFFFLHHYITLLQNSHIILGKNLLNMCYLLIRGEILAGGRHFEFIHQITFFIVWRIAFSGFERFICLNYAVLCIEITISHI